MPFRTAGRIVLSASLGRGGNGRASVYSVLRVIGQPPQSGLRPVPPARRDGRGRAESAAAPRRPGRGLLRRGQRCQAKSDMTGGAGECDRRCLRVSGRPR